MKSNFKKLPKSVIELEVELTKEEFKSYWDNAYSFALGKVNLKGFRPGNVPEELAKDAVDNEAVFEKAAEDAARATLKRLSEENSWIFIDRPQVEILEASPPSLGESRKPGLKYKAVISIFPEINLGDYKKAAKEVVLEKKEINVSEEEIEKALGWLRDSRAKLVLVNRSSKKGDLLEADIKSFNGKDPIPGGEIKNDRFVLGESRFMPGFDDNLLNHSPNENLNFNLTAPSNYWQKDLQGKEINFQVKINSVYERQLPELNDEFAKSLGKGLESLGVVKENIKQGLLVEKQEKERELARAKILQKIIKGSKIDPPQILINKTLEQMLEEVKAMMSGQASYSDEELRGQLLEKAQERVLANLVMHKISELEHLEPIKEEIESEAKLLNLDAQSHYDYIYSILRHKKVFEFLEKE